MRGWPLYNVAASHRVQPAVLGPRFARVQLTVVGLRLLLFFVRFPNVNQRQALRELMLTCVPTPDAHIRFPRHRRPRYRRKPDAVLLRMIYWSTLTRNSVCQKGGALSGVEWSGVEWERGGPLETSHSPYVSPRQIW